jgi:hypothetical protein
VSSHTTDPLAPQLSAGRALEEARASIVATAAGSIRHGKTHYDAAGPDETQRRLEALYDQLLAAVSSRDLSGIVGYARRLAAERFSSGYDLAEVQGAFNALEEAAWSRLCADLRPEQLELSLGLVSTVLGAAKDALAREYVSLASRTHVPSLDMSALFTGDAGA